MVSEHEGRTTNHIGKRSKEDEATLDKLREEMNMKEKEVHNNYRRLKTKVLVTKPAEFEFEDQRVRDLWKKAKELIKSEDQLAIMKVCLVLVVYSLLVPNISFIISLRPSLYPSLTHVTACRKN